MCTTDAEEIRVHTAAFGLAQLVSRFTLATAQVAGPGWALLAALPVASVPDRVVDWPAASELLKTLISPTRAPLASLTLIVINAARAFPSRDVPHVDHRVFPSVSEVDE